MPPSLLQYTSSWFSILICRTELFGYCIWVWDHCWGLFSICQYSNTEPTLAGCSAILCISVNSFYENRNLRTTFLLVLYLQLILTPVLPLWKWLLTGVPSQWRVHMRPFVQFKTMFSPCQISSHPFGSVLRASAETGEACLNGKRQLQGRTWFFKGPLPPSVSPLVRRCRRPHDRPALPPHDKKRPNRNIGGLNLMILSIWERSDSYVCILFNPGCCQSQ